MRWDEGRQEDLRRLAEAVADGSAVDWNAAGSAAPALMPELDNLRAIATISHWCHRVGEEAVVERGDGEQQVTAAEGGAMATIPSPEVPFAEVSSARGPEPGAVGTPRCWGPLTLHECLGKGSFAEVYRATDPLLEREVALKLFRPERVPPARGWDGLLEEARRLAQVRHPNVIAVHGADVHAGRAGLWTELLCGETLERSLERRGPCSADEAAVVGAELCAALAAIHAAGLVHGDVTTSNVMRVDGGRIVLMDFGSAHEAQAAGECEALRTGTPLTLAPEVLAGARPNFVADVYQLGVLLYRLVSRSYPVEAASLDELVMQHERRHVVRLRDRRADLPAAYVQVVERALAPVPAHRFGSVGEMELALRATLAASRPLPARRRRRLLPFAVLAGAVLVALLGAQRWKPNGIFARAPRVQAALFRVHAGVAEPLDARARLLPGDALFMTVESREDLHLYVFNEAASEPGTLNPLFPDPGLRLQNPLPGGVAHRLPASSTGEALWQASPTGGTERILVVATRTRFDLLEEVLAAQQVQAAATPAVDERSMEALHLRAIRLRQSPQSASSAIDALLPQLETRRQRGRDLWFQLIELMPETAPAAAPDP